MHPLSCLAPGEILKNTAPGRSSHFFSQLIIVNQLKDAVGQRARVILADY